MATSMPIAWGDFLGDMPQGMPLHGWTVDDPHYAKWYSTYQGAHKESLPPPGSRWNGDAKKYLVPPVLAGLQKAVK